MKITTRALFVVLFAVGAAVAAQSQPRAAGGPFPRINLKTNLFSDATTSLSLGAEVRTGARSSLEFPFSYNPFTFSQNRKWKHILVQPELRWWPRGTFDRHFWGLHAHYAFYNVGNLPHGPFSQYMKDHRFEGWLAGAGISYGYRWNFDYRWALEATVGVGYAYLDYDKFTCGRCGELLASETKHYFGPTKVGLSLILGLGRKPEPLPTTVVYVPQPQPEPQPEPQPQPVVEVYRPILAAGFVTPEVEAVKARSESGKAFLDFAVGRSEIVPGFRNNASELQKIHITIESVRNDADATITGIGITGYASPEGSAASNQSLSARRAEALRNYIGAEYGLPNNLFAVWGGGEDWKTLDSLAAASSLSEKYALLEVIRSDGDADAREQRLKGVAGGGPYRQLLAEFYPQLRRSDYTIRYTVVPFTVEQGKEVIKTRPGSLSLNEMFLIANTYAPGSEAFNEVFETAVRVFPQSDVANLNASASALNRGDAVSADRYLSKVQVHTPEYWNNAGVLRWLQGDKAGALEAFTRAGALGAKNAEELGKHLESLDTEK